MKTKRHIASYVLLAVFLPMLMLSSLHVHPSSLTTGDSCTECINHHCGGHLAQQTTTMHACVLCQFISLPFLAAATIAVVLYKKVYKLSDALHLCNLQQVCSGIDKPRGPPTA